MGAEQLAARLRAFFAEAYFAPKPERWSAAELAEQFTRPRASASLEESLKKQNNRERQVRRAISLIRRTYGSRFVEIQVVDGRQTLAPIRYIRPLDERKIKSGGKGPFWISLSDRSVVNLRDLELRDHGARVSTPLAESGDLEIKASSDRARARTQRGDASRSKPLRTERVRTPARPLQIPRTPLLEAPVALDEGLRAALLAKHGPDGLQKVLEELRDQKYHLRLDAAVLAARTLAERASHLPVRLLRYLFQRACDGDLLCDAKAAAVDTERCERDAIAANPELEEESWSRLHELLYGYEFLKPKEERWVMKIDPPRPPPMDDDSFAAGLKQRDRRQARERAEESIRDEFYRAVDALGDLPESILQPRLEELRRERDAKLAALAETGPPGAA